MSELIKVPDPVYHRLKDESDERGIPMGAVVESWMQAHDRQASIRDDFREAMETRDGGEDE